MKIHHRNTFSKRFEGKATVEKILLFALALEQRGWLMDNIIYPEGIEIDSEGITLHFVKISDEREKVTPQDEIRIYADIALNLAKPRKNRDAQKPNL